MNLDLKEYKLRLLIFFSFLFLVYWLTESNLFPFTDQTFSQKSRGIDTYPKFILNGIMGQFFNFKWIGNIVFLIPIFFYEEIKNKLKNNKIFSFTIFISITIIALKGYFGWRYMYTLLPLFLIFFSNEVASKSFIQKIKDNRNITIFLFVIILSILNCYVLNMFGNDWLVKRFFLFSILFFSIASIYSILKSDYNLLLLSNIFIAECLFFRYDFNSNKNYWFTIFLFVSFTFLLAEFIRNSNQIIQYITKHLRVGITNYLVKGISFLSFFVLFILFSRKSIVTLTTDFAIVIILVIAVYYKEVKSNFRNFLFVPTLIFYFIFNYNISQIGSTETKSFDAKKSIQNYFTALNAPFVRDTKTQLLVNYIEKNIPQTETILLNHLPTFYYYSKNKYLYYWCQEDHAFNEKGIIEIFANKEFKNVYIDLKNNLGVKYILTSNYKNQFCQVPLDEFVNKYCIKIYSKDDYELFKLK